MYLRFEYEVLAHPEGVQSLGLSAAGRTDAGVHSRGQVVSFRMPLLAMSPLQVNILLLVLPQLDLMSMILHSDFPNTPTHFDYTPINVYDVDQFRLYDSVHYGTSRQK